MHLYYLAFARIPTEKAHGLTIVKGCDAFARAGATVTLVLPRRHTTLPDDLYQTYGVGKTFTVAYLPTIDLIRFSGSALAFWISYTSYYISLFFYLLFKARTGAVLYTRDAPLLTMRLLGYSIFYECHHIFSRSVLYFALVRCARGIVPITASLRNAFLEVGIRTPSLVAPSGFDPATFSRATPKHTAREELGLPQEAFIALYSGNFTSLGKDKGISDIIKALTDAPEVLFVAVGGAEGDRERYAREAQAAGVSERVQLRGYALQTTLALYQDAADVLLMPFPDTPHYRTNMSPVKMFEYLASGKPIIASNLPTIVEVLNDTSALLVNPGAPHEIAAALSRLRGDTALAQRIGAEGKKESHTYSWDNRARRVLAFIKEQNLIR